MLIIFIYVFAATTKYVMYRLIDSSVLFMIGVVSFVIKVDSRDRFELKNVVIT